MRLGLKHRISLPEHAADEIDCCEVEPPVIALTDRPPECCWPAGDERLLTIVSPYGTKLLILATFRPHELLFAGLRFKPRKNELV
jgi:hypothetical protein